MHFVYILWSDRRKASYTGTTQNLAKRLSQHNSGAVISTKAWRSWALVYSEQYETLAEARKREWYLKCTPAGGKLEQVIVRNFLNDRDGGHKVA